MRLVIQRVREASVRIGGKIHSRIGPGLCILAGIAQTDTPDDIAWMASKVARMRVFGDAEGKMNLSVQDTDGDILVISQFTLYASTHKGNRPSFIHAAGPDKAIPLYEAFLSELQHQTGKAVQSGVFGADMDIYILNQGPVTIVMDSNSAGGTASE